MHIDQPKKYKELDAENTRLKKLEADLSLREVILKEVPVILSIKMLQSLLMDQYKIFEQTACSLEGPPRTNYPYMSLSGGSEEPHRVEVIVMVSTYGWFGRLFIADMMRNDGWAPQELAAFR